MENRIYVASLSDYNAGILHGVWIDVNDLDEYDIQEKVDEMLKASPYTKQYGEEAEEWSIHDYELAGIEISESESFARIVEIVEVLEEHGEAFAIHLNDLGDFDDAIKSFPDCYQGEYRSLLEYAEERFDEMFEVPEAIAHYIDYKAYANDLDCSGYYEKDGHVFAPNH